MAALLTLDGISKRFGAVRAVDGVSLELEAGLLHAIVGENGAGKSTLLKVGAGVLTPDEGSVLVDGVPLAPHTAREAIRRGVAMVQQHFALIGAMTALENVILGAEPTGALGRIDWAAARRRAEAVAGDLDVVLAWDTPVRSLGVGDRQRLEIVRAVSRDARVIVLDEPTAVLTPREAEALYASLRRMCDRGRAVAVVTHRLDEVDRHADVVSVLRHGRRVSTAPMRGDRAPPPRSLMRDIMGAEPPPEPPRATRAIGAIRLDVRDLRCRPALRGVTLCARAGEIVGVAGIEGNGQRELVRVLAGLERAESGTVSSAPLAVVHEDRHEEGLVLDASLGDNAVLGELRRFSRYGWVQAEELEAEAGARVGRAGVVPADLDRPARALSGGNQQKVVVARAVARSREPGEQRPTVLVFAQPTRGVDLGAARSIHAEIARCADEGCAVVVVSADLGELRLLCDRILVMTRGRIAAELPRDASDECIGQAMMRDGAA